MSFFKKKPVQFLAIGDVVVDAFIRITEAEVKEEGEAKKLCMPYADKVPFEFVEVVPAVGNSANAAVAVSRLGLTSSLVAGIGDDQNGRDCLNKLREEHVSIENISVHKNKKTNYHYVLWYDKDRTILVNHESFEYTLPKAAPQWMYLSSLGGHTEAFHDEVSEYLSKHPEVKLVFQPGTFQMKLGKERLATIYKHTEIFFCNVEESERILGISGGIANIKNLLDGIHALGPKYVVITDGPNGSYGSYLQGEAKKQFFLPAYPDQKPAYERTGAGDCFASTTTAAIILGKPLEEAMKWGSINSMSVVQYIGAQKGLLTQDKIQEFLKIAPGGWDAKII